jgi:hypothetical protein
MDTTILIIDGNFIVEGQYRKKSAFLSRKWFGAPFASNSPLYCHCFTNFDVVYENVELIIIGEKL